MKYQTGDNDYMRDFFQWYSLLFETKFHWAGGVSYIKHARAILLIKLKKNVVCAEYHRFSSSPRKSFMPQTTFFEFRLFFKMTKMYTYDYIALNSNFIKKTHYENPTNT